MIGNLTLQNNSTNNTPTHHCFPVFDNIIYAIGPIGIASFSLLIGIATIWANTLVVYCIYKTKQKENQSTFLVMITSICDMFHCLTSDVWIVIFVKFSQHIHCEIKIFMFAVGTFWAYGSAYCFCMISIDRYFRVRYLQTYPEVMTPRRFRAMVGVYGLVTFVQGLLSWIGPMWIGIGWGATLARPVNLIVLTLTITFYIMSIRLLKILKKQQRHISEETNKLTSMAFTYLTMLIAFYTPIIVIQLLINQIINSLSKTAIGTLSFMTYYVPSIHAILNAIMFLMKNRSSRRLVVGKIIKWKKSVTCSVSNNNNNNSNNNNNNNNSNSNNNNSSNNNINI